MYIFKIKMSEKISFYTLKPLRSIVKTWFNLHLHCQGCYVNDTTCYTLEDQESIWDVGVFWYSQYRHILLHSNSIDNLPKPTEKNVLNLKLNYFENFVCSNQFTDSRARTTKQCTHILQYLQYLKLCRIMLY